MPLVSATRLRIARARHLLPFYVDTFRSLQQARRAPGYVSGALLRDKERAFWTLTLWEREADMRAYRNGGAHGAAMPKLLRWCDEAAVAHWEQDASGLPTFDDAHARLLHGRFTNLPHPSARHLAREIPPPRGRPTPPLGPKRTRAA